MYHKIINSSQSYKIRTKDQLIFDIIDESLPSLVMFSIFQAYQNRAVDNPEFDYDGFILDLQGFLKFYTEKKLSKQDLKSENIIPTDNYIFKGFRGEKKAYLLTKNNQICRFYYDCPLEFFYRKFAGISFADIRQKINNNLLIAWANNVAGEPFDLMERFLPLDEVRESLADRPDILAQIKQARDSNPLIADFVPDEDLGLVVRQNNLGNKKVYVVVIDFHVEVDFIIVEKGLSYLLKNEYTKAEPKFLDYEKMVKLLPSLSQLTVLNSTK